MNMIAKMAGAAVLASLATGSVAPAFAGEARSVTIDQVARQSYPGESYTQYYYGRGYYGRGYYGRGYYGRGYNRGGAAAAGVIGGLAAGALIGGAIASQQNQGPYYPGKQVAGAPVPMADPDYIAYCSRKYRSFDPATGTYLNNDGNRYPCQ